jgi:hypothetical protein
MAYSHGSIGVQRIGITQRLKLIFKRTYITSVHCQFLFEGLVIAIVVTRPSQDERPGKQSASQRQQTNG